MAVQIPDPGTGNGQTGDNEYVFRKKVKDNFSDQTNAASRLVGTAVGNVMQVGAFGLGSSNKTSFPNYITEAPTETLAKTQMINFSNTGALGYGQGLGWSSGARAYTIVGSLLEARAPYLTTCSDITTTEYSPERAATYKQGEFLVTNYNAKADSNGFYKTSSPTIDVYADKIVANDEANEQNPTFKRNGVGDYTITTQTGLSTDGWYLELPKDLNGNPKVAVGTLDDTDGVITLKTYKRIFSMETFTFVPDLNEPLDIPDGRWIDLRLNEIPVEPSEPKSEV